MRELLSHTDRVLLDIKYTTEDDYRRYVGCDLGRVIRFLDYLKEKNIPTTVRQVIIPSLNDNGENLKRLSEIAKSHPNVDKTELLGFKKICQTKYDNLGIEFPFKDFKTPTKEDIKKLEALL